MNLSLEAVEKNTNKLAVNNPGIVELHSLGISAEGRDINAVYITDKRVSLAEKEVAVVMGLRHGDEVGVVPAVSSLLDWLVSEDGAEIRRRQLVIVIPVVNPDGFIKQEFGAPRDMISDTENKYILPLILECQADMLLDIHSLDRGDLEAVITGHTTHLGEDDLIHGIATGKMAEGAAAAGYPYVIHTLGVQSRAPWLSTPRPPRNPSSSYNNWVCAPAYEQLHSLVIGMEVNSFSLNDEECGNSGLAAIVPLLQLGNTRSFWEYAPGYPNRILRGNIHISLRASGQNAAERRKSRAELWQKREFFSDPIKIMPTTHNIKASIEYSGEPLSNAFSICCRIRGNPGIKDIRLNGTKTDYYMVADNCSSFVFVDVPPAVAGAYEVSIDL